MYRRLKDDTSGNISIYKTVLTHFNQAIGMQSNAAFLVYLAKQERKTPTLLLAEEILQTIYRDTSANTLVQKRDRCILGMMLFLGLQRNKLAILDLDDLKLEEARLYVSQTLTTNERYINLNPKQMMHLSQYYYDVRPKLASEY